MAYPNAIEVGRVRRPALAGSFYPADPGELAHSVDHSLGKAKVFAGRPKAVIAPHAGFVYSGDVAGSAYGAVKARRGEISRVVLLGPCHRVPVAAFAVPTFEAFATPLGIVPLDREGLRQALAVPGMEQRDDTHIPEHCLETQLPFLQRLLGPFSIVPVIVGGATIDQTDALLDALWGGNETLVVVSSDLSHFHTYDEARRLDLKACQRIESLLPEQLSVEQACGRNAIRGLLARAQDLDLRATTIDLCNSGDTAGRHSRDRVVGYGAVAFEDAASSRLGDQDRGQLLKAAVQSVATGLKHGKQPAVAIESYPRSLQAMRACFVTLKQAGRLRGCVGSLKPHQPLVADVASSAFKAAFGDRRFQPLTQEELKSVKSGLDISVSVLSHSRPLAAATEAEALRRVRPGIDGLILRDQGKAALLLPQVWDAIPDPAVFLATLKQKAGLDRGHWSDSLTLLRFTTESFGETVSVTS